MTAASHVPNWMTADAAAPGSPQPRRTGTISRWAVELMGMNSVRPWTRPRTRASRMDNLLTYERGMNLNAECGVQNEECRVQNEECACLHSSLSTLHSEL